MIIMKTLHLTPFILLCSIIQLHTQTRLNVEGDANILGRIFTNVADRSVIIGEDAGLNLNNDANSNVFLGVQAGKDSEFAEDNIFIGRATGFRSEGIENIMIGRSAGFEFEGDNNVIIGTSAGGGIGGNNNVYLGDRAGSSPLNDGSGNVFLGSGSGQNNTQGADNVFVGGRAGTNNKEGDFNTFVGSQAGDSFLGLGGDFNNSLFGTLAGGDLIEGQNNTFIGASAGNGLTNVNVVTLLGAGATANNNASNVSAFGAYSLATQSNQVVIGNVATNELRAYNNWSTLSDKRFKNNVKNDVKGLDFILQLRPVTYQLNAKKLDLFLRAPLGKTNPTDSIETYQAALKVKSNITYTGFIAQEVEHAATKSNFDFSGIVAPKNDEDHYTLRYAEFVVPLVKAVQEQQEIIEEKEAKIEDLEERLIRLEGLMSKDLEPTESREVVTDPHDVKLSQNVPNPVNGITIIEFFIPSEARNAALLVTNVEGKILKKYPIQTRGLERLERLELQSTEFQAGQYFYSLMIDNKIVATKQMLFVD